MDMKTQYDIANLSASAKINLRKFVIRIVIYIILVVLGGLAIIFYGSHLLVFTCGVILACVSAFLCGKLIKKITFADYSIACGEIANIHK